VYKFIVGDMRLGTMLDTICLQKYISQDKLGVKAGNFTKSYSMLVTVISQALAITKITCYMNRQISFNALKILGSMSTYLFILLQFQSNGWNKLYSKIEAYC